MARITTLLSSAALLAVCSQNAGAGTTMERKGNAFPPPAFKSFCARQSTLCGTSGATKAVQLTAPRRAQLARVNALVNRVSQSAATSA
jgi:predicted transglutaminase-like cysteine proteinase